MIDSRSFLSRAYPTMKKNNPYTPIMLREAVGTQPKVYARYGELAFSTVHGRQIGIVKVKRRLLTLSRIWQREERIITW
jgi:Mitochondrial ribosomal protein L51 / S25 / CI-B8 domain